MEDMRTRDMKEEIDNTVDDDLVPNLHQEDLLKENINTEGHSKITNNVLMTTEDIKEMKFIEINYQKMMK